MHDLRLVLLMIAVMTATAAQAADKYAALRTNPFISPEKVTDTQLNKSAEKHKAADMELRATVVAGSRSQANIGGVIVGLGEDVNGYRLAEVHARRVVLEQNGTRKEITIDETDRNRRK
jgi:altronate dehydratase